MFASGEFGTHCPGNAAARERDTYPTDRKNNY